jgi:dihydrofolate synthase / folylpolyglutamate synthase
LNYHDVVQNLEARAIMPKTMPGLEKMKQALSILDKQIDLSESYIITVAGTNGKGTTCAILEGLLRSENKSVGLYTSPHLVSTTERIRYNGESISESDFRDVFVLLKPILDQCELSHFEALTLMAAYYFSKKKCEYILFEVGLGGTYDATNVFPNQMSIITNSRKYPARDC